MAYQPTDKDRWNAQQRAAADARKRAEAAEREAERIRAQMAKDDLAAKEKRRKIAADAEKAADAEAAAEEKSILSAPKTKYIGATKKNTGHILVWHHGVEPPEEMRGPRARAGIGPLLALRPNGGCFQTEDAAVLAIRRAHPDVDTRFPEFIAAHQKALRETRLGYPILNVLRDDKRMAKIFAAAGLTMESKTTETMTGTYGVYQRQVTTVHVPELVDVTIRASGLELTYRHRLGDSAKNWNSKLDTLKNAFRSLGVDPSQMTVSENGGGDIVLRFNDKDPFSAQTIVSGQFDAARGRSLLGIDSTGREVWITWNGSSGMVVGGVPGSGKTASLLPVFAGMVDKAELHVFDGKSGFDLHPLRHIARTYDRTGDLSAPLETLRALDHLRQARAEAMYSTLNANNFWNLSQQQRDRYGLVPVFCILDEVQTWLDTSGMDTDEKGIATKVTRLVRTLVQKGRSAGIVVVLTTQKPDSTSIPTVIRDNAALKVCFRVSTPEQAVTVLGKQAAGTPDPTQILMSTKGRGVMETEGHGIVLFQAGYRSPEDLDAELSSHSPVPSQSEVADSMMGKAPAPSPDNDAAQAAPMPTPAAAAPGPGVDVAVGNGQVDNDAQLLATLLAAAQREPRVFSDEELTALAEAQRRGLIPRPDEPEQPVTKPAPPQPAPEQPQPTPEPKGFDF